MAVDTATKRQAISQLGRGRHYLPRPDGTIADHDRLLLIGAYSFASEGGSGNFWWLIFG